MDYSYYSPHFGKLPNLIMGTPSIWRRRLNLLNPKPCAPRLLKTSRSVRGPRGGSFLDEFMTSARPQPKPRTLSTLHPIPNGIFHLLSHSPTNLKPHFLSHSPTILIKRSKPRFFLSASSGVLLAYASPALGDLPGNGLGLRPVSVLKI